MEIVYGISRNKIGKNGVDHQGKNRKFTSGCLRIPPRIEFFSSFVLVENICFNIYVVAQRGPKTPVLKLPIYDKSPRSRLFTFLFEKRGRCRRGFEVFLWVQYLF